eukprot:3713007-Pyramimonas_sp.AAC.1
MSANLAALAHGLGDEGRRVAVRSTSLTPVVALAGRRPAAVPAVALCSSSSPTSAASSVTL